MTRTVSAASLTLLTSIAAATQGGGFLYAQPDAIGELEGLVEQNSEMTSDEGLATRVTDEGFTFLASLDETKGIEGNSTSVAAETSAPVLSGSFSKAGIVKRERKSPGGANRKSRYPFDTIGAPDAANPDDVQGFFVAATAKMPDPVKSLASAVSNFNRKHGTVVGSETVVIKGKETVRNKYEYNTVFFEIAPYTNNGVKGALVYRSK